MIHFTLVYFGKKNRLESWRGSPGISEEGKLSVLFAL